jgi:hypothetical protein
MAPIAAQQTGGESPAAVTAAASPWEEEDDEDDEEDIAKTPDLSWIVLPWTEMADVEWRRRECYQAPPTAT